MLSTLALGKLRGTVLRSFLAISAGFIATIALAIGIDIIIQSYAPKAFAEIRTNNSANLWLSVSYAVLATILGSYLTGKLAPGKPTLHALILGGIGFTVSIAITITQWYSAPMWYHGLVLLLVLPSAYAGGLLASNSKQYAHVTAR